MPRWKALAAVIGTSLTMLVAVSPAVAAPADRAESLAAYRSVLADQRVPTGWTGSVADCLVGTESAASLSATLRTVNLLRSFADLGSVTFAPEKNQKALAAALIMRAQGRLSHYPDPSWRCYSDSGAAGAGGSNLYIGGVGLESSGAGAIVAYLQDRGVESLGHRRWLLQPGAVEFGSGSTGSTNALYVLDATGDGSREAAWPAAGLVAWPPAGWVPWRWVYEDWSLAIGRPTSDPGAADFIGVAAAPIVSVRMNGEALPVRDVRVLERGYGTGPMLTWRVGVPEEAKRADRVLEVSISGATLGGSPLPISYQVMAYAPDADPGRAATPTPVDQVCPSLRRKLKRAQAQAKTAMRRLVRLKKRSRKATKKAHFSRRLKRARRNFTTKNRQRKRTQTRYRQRCLNPPR